MVGEDGTNLRTARIGAFNPLWVRHHAAGFLPNLVGVIGKPDRIAVALGHPSPVEAWQSRRFGWQVSRLTQYLVTSKKFPVLADAFEKIRDADFERAPSESCG